MHTNEIEMNPSGRTGPVADALRSTADAIRDKAEALHHDEIISERVADLAQGAADRIDSTAEYLQTHELASIAGKAGVLARRHPVPAMLIAAAVGYWVGKALADRRDRP